MKNKTITTLLFLVFFAMKCFCQSEGPTLYHVLGEYGNRNFFDIKDSMDNFYSQMVQQNGDSILLGEGYGYASYQRWVNEWEHTLYSAEVGVPSTCIKQ